MPRGKSIISWRKQFIFLKELTDEEIAEIVRTSTKYKDNEDFHKAIDSEIKYRMQKQLEK